MSPRRRSPKREQRDLVKEGRDLGDTLRNERQKSVLLAEVGRLHRKQVGDAIENTKQAIERSKKLCPSADKKTRDNRDAG